MDLLKYIKHNQMSFKLNTKLDLDLITITFASLMAISQHFVNNTELDSL